MAYTKVTYLATLETDIGVQALQYTQVVKNYTEKNFKHRIRKAYKDLDIKVYTIEILHTKPHECNPVVRSLFSNFSPKTKIKQVVK